MLAGQWVSVSVQNAASAEPGLWDKRLGGLIRLLKVLAILLYINIRPCRRVLRSVLVNL